MLAGGAGPQVLQEPGASEAFLLQEPAEQEHETQKQKAFLLQGLSRALYCSSFRASWERKNVSKSQPHFPRAAQKGDSGADKAIIW